MAAAQQTRVQGLEQFFLTLPLPSSLKRFCTGCVQKQPYLSLNCFLLDSDARRYMNSAAPTGGNYVFCVKGQRITFHSNTL